MAGTVIESRACPRPTHIGLELRLTVEEADALTTFLDKFRSLIESRCMTCPEQMREPLLNGMSKLTDRLNDRQPPFDQT